MKFEKINKDKIKVTINREDLTQKDIDLHSFFADSEETQALFLDVLDTAERDFGFSTENYNLKVETIALSNGVFILTITRILNNDSVEQSLENTNLKKQPHISRKVNTIASTVVYQFKSFDDFCNFVNHIYTSLGINVTKIAKESSLYLFNQSYYLVMSKLDTNYEKAKQVFSSIVEFGVYANSSDVFIAKLHESGKPIFTSKALSNCIKFFNK